MSADGTNGEKMIHSTGRTDTAVRKMVSPTVGTDSEAATGTGGRDEGRPQPREASHYLAKIRTYRNDRTTEESRPAPRVCSAILRAARPRQILARRLFHIRRAVRTTIAGDPSCPRRERDKSFAVIAPGNPSSYRSSRVESRPRLRRIRSKLFVSAQLD